jgi:hypothetical protein
MVVTAAAVEVVCTIPPLSISVALEIFAQSQRFLKVNPPCRGVETGAASGFAVVLVKSIALVFVSVKVTFAIIIAFMDFAWGTGPYDDPLFTQDFILYN